MGASCLTYNKWSTKFLIYDVVPKEFSLPLESNISDQFSSTNGCGEILEKGKFLTGDDDGNLSVFTYDKSGIIEMNKYPISDMGITSLLTDFKNSVVCASFDGNVKIFDLEEERIADFYDLHLDKVCSLSSINSIDLFCTASLDGTCLLIDRNMKKPAKILVDCAENPATTIFGINSTNFLIGKHNNTFFLI